MPEIQTPIPDVQADLDRIAAINVAVRRLRPSGGPLDARPPHELLARRAALRREAAAIRARLRAVGLTDDGRPVPRNGKSHDWINFDTCDCGQPGCMSYRESEKSPL